MSTRHQQMGGEREKNKADERHSKCQKDIKVYMM